MLLQRLLPWCSRVNERIRIDSTRRQQLNTCLFSTMRRDRQTLLRCLTVTEIGIVRWVRLRSDLPWETWVVSRMRFLIVFCWKFVVIICGVWIRFVYFFNLICVAQLPSVNFKRHCFHYANIKFKNLLWSLFHSSDQ